MASKSTPSSHVSLSENVDHVEQLLFRTLPDLLGQEQSRIHGALRIDLPAPHVVLELEGHRAVLRCQTVGVVGMAGEVFVRDVELVLLRLDVPDLLDGSLQGTP